MGEKMDKAKGRIKQAVGSLTGDKELVREGKADELKGEVEGVIADAKKTLKDAVK